MAAIIRTHGVSTCVVKRCEHLFTAIDRMSHRNKEMVPKRAYPLTQTVGLTVESVIAVDPFRRFR